MGDFNLSFAASELDAAVAAAFAAAPQSTTYKKAETDALLGEKAPQSTTYTKNEVDAITGDKTNLNTSAKTNLVAAINELNSGKAVNVSSNIWTQDLGTITTNSFVVYNNSATDSPVSGSYGFCRTSVFDVNSMMQEVTLISEPYGDSYIRVKAGGTWKPWKKTTNN